MLATDELLTRDFQISWCDRFPPTEAAPTRPTSSAAAMGAALTAVLEPVAGDRSNRVKFRCPVCTAQAWGKPSLRLLCGNEACDLAALRSEEHTSELQSLMRNSYAVFCLKKKKTKTRSTPD